MRGYERAMERDERESKLPVWAQRKMEALREMTERARSVLEDSLLKTLPEESSAILNPYGDVQLGVGPQGLGRRADVRFPLRAVDKGHAYVDARVESDQRWLRIVGGDRLYVIFDAGNSMRVTSTHEEL